MHHPYTIELCDGKYTIINEYGRALKFLRHGEEWPAANNLRHDNVVKAMADRIEELEVAVKAVLDGTLLENGHRANISPTCVSMAFTLGISIPPSLLELQQWERLLRNVLEQKP